MKGAGTKVDGFIYTKQVLRMFEMCQTIRTNRDMGLIYGPPGVGKTLSTREYTLRNTNEGHAHKVLYMVADVISSPKTVIMSFLTEMHSDYQWDTVMGKGIVCDYLKENRTELVFIDEADRLKTEALETVRDIYDRTGCPMVFVGMPGLGRKLSRHAQLYSRIGFVNEFSMLSFEELWGMLPEIDRRLFGKMDKENKPTLELAKEVFKVTKGNLRILQRLIQQTARLMEINEKRELSKDIIRSASKLLMVGNG